MNNINTDPLGTPVYLKTSEAMPWPKDKTFYILSKDGLSLCRNHLWFTSCAPANKGPSELVEQKPFLKLSYPTIPRALIEKAVGFFHRVFKKHDWESALLFVWNKATGQIELICPEQKCSWGTVKYDIPKLPPNLLLIGDIHCQCDMTSTPSQMDEDDEVKRPGLHLVVGRIKSEPPEFYAAAVVDGVRFESDIDLLIEDYIQRDLNFPEEWIDKVKEHKYTWEHSGSYGGYGSGWSGLVTKPSKEDMEIINRICSKRVKDKECPDMITLRQELFCATKGYTYRYCEELATKFVRNWNKMKGHPHEELIGKE